MSGTEGMGSNSTSYEGDDFLGDPAPGDAATEVGDASDSDAVDTSAGAGDVGASARAADPAATRARGADSRDADAAEPATTAAELPADLRAALSAEHLPLVPGESTDAATARLVTHLRGARNRFYNDFLTRREEAQAASRELREFKEAMTPMLQSWYQQQQAAAREAALAAIPDKELDPQGYDRWLLETNLRETFSQRQEREQEQARYAQEAQQAAQLDADLGVGEAILNELEQAVTSDPEVGEAYRFSTNMMADAIMLRNPGVSREQALAQVPLFQAADLRRAHEAGVPIADFLRANHQTVLRQLEAVGYRLTREQQAAASGAPSATVNGAAGGGTATSNSNGRGASTPGTRKSPSPNGGGSPTATRIAAQRAQAAARAVVGASQAAAAPAGAGQFNPLDMDEEAFLEEALSSPSRLSEINAAFRDQYAKHSWRGGD